MTRQHRGCLGQGWELAAGRVTLPVSHCRGREVLVNTGLVSQGSCVLCSHQALHVDDILALLVLVDLQDLQPALAST